jgi:hypothetical protein
MENVSARAVIERMDSVLDRQTAAAGRVAEHASGL